MKEMIHGTVLITASENATQPAAIENGSMFGSMGPLAFLSQFYGSTSG
jgi:hypothetical protein